MDRFRHEYKYQIDSATAAILKIRAQGVLLPDSHVDEDGSYYIRSLYFDDRQDSCLLENISGTDPRSKFRIRYYNNNTQRIQLEKKSKQQGMTLKEACTITCEECRSLMNGIVPEITQDMPAQKKKLFAERTVRALVPKVIVSYERIPFVYSGGNVRVTFDRKLTSSLEIASFLDGNYVSRPVFAKGQSILEVKWDEILPRHIQRVLQLDQLQWTAFSKYGMCRKYHL